MDQSQMCACPLGSLRDDEQVHGSSGCNALKSNEYSAKEHGFGMIGV